MFIYAMSDIHGEREAFEDALSVVDFSDERTLVVLCGDYIDRFHLRPEFFRYVREFQESHEGQVVALMGNHEVAYLEELGRLADPLVSDANERAEKKEDVGARPALDKRTLRWLRQLPLYYETDAQVFVHAGIDEEAGEYWKVGTEERFFHSKFPCTFGVFEKDIVAGHVGTYQMCGENRVFWDGQSHFYLDGTTEISGIVPVLKYDTETGAYTSFEKVDFGGGIVRWSEYAVKAGGGDGKDFA